MRIPQCSIWPFWDMRVSPSVDFALMALTAPPISRLSALHLKAACQCAEDDFRAYRRQLAFTG